MNPDLTFTQLWKECPSLVERQILLSLAKDSLIRQHRFAEGASLRELGERLQTLIKDAHNNLGKEFFPSP